MLFTVLLVLARPFRVNGNIGEDHAAQRESLMNGLGWPILAADIMHKGTLKAGALEEGKQSRYRSRDGSMRGMGPIKEDWYVSLTKICIRGASQALGVKRVAYVLTGVLGLSVVASQVAAVPVASAATFNHTRGYSVQHGWLCYGWGDGSLHCTQAWHRSSSGQAISENPAWVPNTGTSGGNTYFVGLALNTTSTTTSTASHTGRVSPSAARSVSPKISAWASTGRAAYAMHDFAGDPNHGTFGSCTWYAWYRHQNEPLLRLGNAAQWAYSARSHGLATGSAPSAGATVVFQGGVQGASGLGHVGHVEAVYGGGWFLLSEMSFTWNGGGWGRVSYRYAHTGAGVSFIY